MILYSHYPYLDKRLGLTESSRRDTCAVPKVFRISDEGLTYAVHRGLTYEQGSAVPLPSGFGHRPVTRRRDRLPTAPEVLELHIVRMQVLWWVLHQGLDDLCRREHLSAQCPHPEGCTECPQRPSDHEIDEVLQDIELTAMERARFGTLGTTGTRHSTPPAALWVRMNAERAREEAVRRLHEAAEVNAEEVWHDALSEAGTLSILDDE